MLNLIIGLLVGLLSCLALTVMWRLAARIGGERERDVRAPQRSATDQR